MNGSRHGTGYAAAGFVAGLLIGVLVWGRHMRRSRSMLFGESTLGRLAAIGQLSNQPSVDNARLLRDYVNWEQQPLLQRRGRIALRKVEQALRPQAYHE